MPRFDNVGKAILLLREKQNKSQKVLAAEAGITGAMLSNYETGVKKPSLDSLGKILDALGLYLGKLDDALDVVNDREYRRGEDPRRETATGAPEGVDLPRFLGAQGDLTPDLELGFSEMVRGFQRVARHIYQNMVSPLRRRN
jgi:transcriptional regulator with XRE-family HTH domain